MRLFPSRWSTGKPISTGESLVGDGSLGRLLGWFPRVSRGRRGSLGVGSLARDAHAARPAVAVQGWAAAINEAS